MFQTRSLILVASLGIAAGLAVLSPVTASAGGDCDGLKISEVQAVCAKGGKKAVQQAMKDAIKNSTDAKAKSLKCGDCHENQNDYKLKGNAEDDFKAKLLPSFNKPAK